MKYGRYGWTHLFLRIGLGITFVWIGWDMLHNPSHWIAYLPNTGMFLGLEKENVIQYIALFDMALGVAFLMRIWIRLAAALSAIHLAGILVIHGVDAVIIRDVGLIGASLALLAWPTHKNQRILEHILPSRLFSSRSGGNS